MAFACRQIRLSLMFTRYVFHELHPIIGGLKVWFWPITPMPVKDRSSANSFSFIIVSFMNAGKDTGFFGIIQYEDCVLCLQDTDGSQLFLRQNPFCVL